MQPILQWPPILWTLRIVILILLIGGTTVLMLLSARFFRWRHVKALFRAELPQVHSVGGEFAGTKATVQLVRKQHEEMEAVIARLDGLEKMVMSGLIVPRSNGRMSETTHDTDTRQALVDRMITEQVRLKAANEAATRRKLALLEALERSVATGPAATPRAGFARLRLRGKRRRDG